jgi:microcystin-dependent protein
MAVDWNTPSLSQLWADFLTAITGRDTSAATMDFTGDTNLPTGCIRWNTGNNRFERWTGATWTALTPDVSSVTGILPAANFNDTAHGSRSGGTLHAAATGSTAGFLSSTDKSKLDNATASPTVSTIVLRDANGRAQVATPSAAADIVRKDYADALGVSAPTVSTIMRRDAAGRAQVATPSAAEDIVRKDYADALGVSVPTVSTIIRRDASGRAQVADPDAAQDIATKNYVDTSSTAWTTGDVKLSIKTTADTGWVLMNDTTIGNASSGATGRANADTSALFTLLWTNTSDANCAVSGGRGATASADYAANKTIALPKTLGRALAVYGSGSGLTARTMAQALGSENAIVVTHNHGVTDPSHRHTTGGNFDDGLGGASGGVILNGGTHSGATTMTGFATTGITINNAGSSGTGANMPPTLFLNVMIKL